MIRTILTSLTTESKEVNLAGFGTNNCQSGPVFADANGTIINSDTTYGNTHSHNARNPTSKHRHLSSHHQLTSFRITALDIPEQRVLRGTSNENVPSISAQFRNRVELKRDLDTRPEKIDKRAVRSFSIQLKTTAMGTYSELSLGIL